MGWVENARPQVQTSWCILDKNFTYWAFSIWCSFCKSRGCPSFLLNWYNTLLDKLKNIICYYRSLQFYAELAPIWHCDPPKHPPQSPQHHFNSESMIVLPCITTQVTLFICWSIKCCRIYTREWKDSPGANLYNSHLHARDGK